MSSTRKTKSGKWVYLLSQVGWPTEERHLFEDDDDEIVTSWERAQALPQLIGITIQPLTIVLPMDKRPGKRELRVVSFQILDGVANDDYAQRFADATVATLILIHGQFIWFEPMPSALRIPAASVRSYPLDLRKVLGGQAVIEHYPELQPWEMKEFFWNWAFVPDSTLANVWRLLPAAIRDPFFSAVHYYLASVSEYCFMGDDIGEVLGNDPQTPFSQKDIVRAENALFNAFKAIEALIGEPPRDSAKLRRKLSEAGVHPDEIVGWQRGHLGPGKEPIMEKIYRLYETRDKRAAHAKIPRKAALTLYEIMDAQGCARAVLLLALDFALTLDQQPTRVLGEDS